MYELYMMSLLAGGWLSIRISNLQIDESNTHWGIDPRFIFYYMTGYIYQNCRLILKIEKGVYIMDSSIYKK